ncbi:MAG TPA: ABC transporter substrate-binding protein [Verrucomicrobiae bacterium]|nr:ABC transporter substrate-binding protein [Verrucomicrobiae bacterium]
MMQRRHGLLIGSVFIYLLSVFSAANAGGTRVIIAYSSINPNSSQLEIGRAQGFYRKYGLEPDIILVRSSATASAGLAAGNIHFGFIGGSALLNAAAEGLPLKMLASFDAQLTYDIIARPEIKSINDLKGKKFAVGSLGGTPWMAARLAFEYLGLDEKRDRIQIVAMSNQTSRYHALEQGSVDAAILQGNFSRSLKAKGFSVIVDLEQAKIPFVGAGVVVSSRFLRENQGTIENLLKALLETQSFINASENKPAVLKTMGVYLKEGNPPALHDGFQVLSANMSRKPFPSIAGLNNIKRILAVSSAKVGNVKSNDLIDDSFMRKFDRSGLLDRALAGSL